jgi:hypothetical protein
MASAAQRSRGVQTDNPLTSFNLEVPANISLRHWRSFDRNNRSLSNICVRNNRWPSDRRLIYSIEVPIRDLRVISGMWKTPVNR